MKLLKYTEFINESYDTSFDYEDDYVIAKLRNIDGTLEILEWHSKNFEKGGTEKTLIKLRREYSIIHAIDCGYDHEESFKYWEHMLSKGLIDGFIDDNGGFYDQNDINESVSISDIFKENILKSHPAFNDREDADEYLSDMLEYYNNLGETVILYRVIFIDSDDDEELNTDDFGNHWTPVESLMLDENWLEKLRDVSNLSHDSDIYIIKAKFKTSDINWEWTIDTNMNHPHEEEIMINDNVTPIDYDVYNNIEEFKNK